MFLSEAMELFLEEWYTAGISVVRKYDLPVEAMLACAAEESGWGKGPIFQQTLNPFNLQKWPHLLIPKTHKTYWRETIINTTTREKKKSPFNCAYSSEDAVRQWCEWILNYGNANSAPGNQDPKASKVPKQSAIRNRNALLRCRKNSIEFARNLPLVGFGQVHTPQARAKSGQGYTNIVQLYTKPFCQTK